MKKINKRGLLGLGVTALFWLFGIIILLGLLIWLGFKISGAVGSFFDFIKDNLLWVIIALFVVLFFKQVRGILNFVLGKIGIKI